MIDLKKIKLLFALLALGGAALVANESNNDLEVEQTTIIAGERSEDRSSVEQPPEEEIAVDSDDSGCYKVSIPLVTALPENSAELVTEEALAMTKSGYPQIIRKALVQSSHTGAMHELQKFWWYDGIVALEDGSYWILSDAEAARNFFYAGATLAVGYSGDYGYPYWLTNQQNGVAIMAKLWKITPTGYSRRVTAIDYSNSNIWLNDGSRWELAAEDFDAIAQSRLNDWMVIGLNGDIFNYIYPNILINVNTNRVMRGVCVN